MITASAHPGRFSGISLPTCRDISRVTTIFLATLVNNKIIVTYCIGVASLLVVNWQIAVLTMIVVSSALSLLEYCLKSLFNNALCTAASRGDVRVLKALKGCSKLDLHLRNDLGQTPLILAAKNGHTNVVKELKNFKGIDPDLADLKGKTPLMYAAVNGHADVVEALGEFKGIFPNYGDTESKTALMLASENGHAKVVDVLVKIGGVNPNFVDVRGKTALILAVENGKASVVQALRGFEDNSNLIDRVGRNITAFVYQEDYEQVEIDPNIKDPNGKTAYMLAYESDSKEVLKELHEFKGIDTTTNQPKVNATLFEQTARAVCKTALRVLNHRKIKPIADSGSRAASGFVVAGRSVKKGEFRKAGRSLVFGLSYGLEATFRVMTFQKDR